MVTNIEPHAGAFPSRSRSTPQSGIALFVVMVVVVVLTVVVFQLSYSTKIEERVAANRKGMLELSISLPAIARSVPLKLRVDYDEDQAGGSAGGENPMAGGGGAGSGAEVPPPPSGGGSSESQAGGTDSRHEIWAHPYTESINELEVRVTILDGEGRLNLNEIFKYLRIEDGDGLGDGAGSPGDEGGTDPTPEPDPAPPSEGNDGEDPEEEEAIEEYEPPTPEQIEGAHELLSRLIQAVIMYNQEHGFEYESTPLADNAAGAIVQWVEARLEDEKTRRIRRLEGIKDLPELSWELFDGPRNPEEEETDEEDDLDDSIRSPLGDLADFLGRDVGEIGEIGELEGFYEVEDGVEAIPQPLGLKHVLTTHSTGKINLNTARPEVLAALLISFDDLDDAYQIALEIDTYLNSYVDLSEEEDSAGEPETAPEGDSGDLEEESQPEFNIFTSFEDLKGVNEEWEDQELAEDESEFEMIQKDLGHLAVFRSTFFSAYLDGEREDQKVQGALVLRRAEGKIDVLSWREISR